VAEELLQRLFADVQKYQACIAAVPAKDTIKVANRERMIVDTPDRATLWQAQTPQVFAYSLIRKCYEKALADQAAGLTDDASCVEYCGKGPVYLTEGSYDNLKITTPEDLPLAETICEKYR
jgi:2-C-methyl-D-erythritol 4-phosphate cytidylyltransferase